MTARSRRRSPDRKRWTRKSQGRPEKTTLLIVCEGRETERNYLDQLKREDDVARRFAIKVCRGKGGSRLQIVRHAVDRKADGDQAFDEVWCVMDIEKQDTAESRSDLKTAVGLAKQENVVLCLSNPAFEVWILAHFIRSCQSFHDGDAVIRELNGHWKAAFDVDYAKKDQRIYSRIAGRTTQAIENAKAVREQDHRDKTDIADCNSATEVYRLVQYLTGPPPH